MGHTNWSDLFPTKWSLVIFILYILLFINQGILVTASQESNNEYHYDIVTVVLVTEIFKLIASTALYCKDNSPKALLLDTIKNKRVLALYFVPAFLYCFYNNLSFVNLSKFDPTTYYLLLQFRVVITAVLFQLIFKKQLSKKQWFSLLLLTIGCMIKQVNFTDFTNTKEDSQSSPQKSTSFNLNINAVLILIQATCSCLAGVYNEYLLKEPGAEVNIYTQNVFMYLDSIVCNTLVLFLQGNIYCAFTLDSLRKVFHYKVVVVMINNAAIGIITSFFLKNLNSILKTFASALELIFTAVLCYILFRIPIHLNTVLSIGVVLYSIFLYSQNPVSNVGKIAQTSKVEEQEELLMEEV